MKASSPVTPTLITWSRTDKFGPAYNVNTSSRRAPRGVCEVDDAILITRASRRTSPTASGKKSSVWRGGTSVRPGRPLQGQQSGAARASGADREGGAFPTLREFQRVLFNSQTYQRAASSSPDLEKGPYLFPGPLVRRMTAEQVWDSLMVVSVGSDIDNMLLRRGDDEKLMSIPGNTITAENLKEAIHRLREASVPVSASKKKGGGSGKRPRCRISVRQAAGAFRHDPRPRAASCRNPPRRRISCACSARATV